ncbi:MAG: energy transducer TonB [Caulobacter sp.]|nr:energy transducer TonB [Vitreoscilla sp.]
MTAISFRTSTLPWALAHDDEERFRKLFLALLGFVIVFGIALRFITLPEPERTVAPSLPPIAAKLLLDKPAPPPPPPPKVEKVEPPKPDAADKREAAPLPTKPVPRERPVVEARQPIPGKPPGEDREAARNKAAGIGLLAALKDQSPELHGAPVAVQLNQDIKKGAGVGSGTGVGVGAGKEQGLPDRNMITSNAAGGSGGINTAGFSRDSGGGGLAGRATTAVLGAAGGGGGGGPGLGGQISGSGGHGMGTGGKAGGTLAKSGSGKASRSIEEVRLVLERNKGALYAIYNRALREDASLQGKFVVEFTISPNGSVTACTQVSSELKNPELEQKLLARFRSMTFPAEDVETLVTRYPIDFLPS